MCLEYLYCGVAAERSRESAGGILLLWRAFVELFVSSDIGDILEGF